MEEVLGLWELHDKLPPAAPLALDVASFGLQPISLLLEGPEGHTQQ